LNNQVKVMRNPTSPHWNRRKTFGGFFVSFVYEFCTFWEIIDKNIENSLKTFWTLQVAQKISADKFLFWL